MVQIAVFHRRQISVEKKTRQKNLRLKKATKKHTQTLERNKKTTDIFQCMYTHRDRLRLEQSDHHEIVAFAFNIQTVCSKCDRVLFDLVGG